MLFWKSSTCALQYWSPRVPKCFLVSDNQLTPHFWLHGTAMPRMLGCNKSPSTAPSLLLSLLSEIAPMLKTRGLWWSDVMTCKKQNCKGFKRDHFCSAWSLVLLSCFQCSLHMFFAGKSRIKFLLCFSRTSAGRHTRIQRESLAGCTHINSSRLPTSWYQCTLST